MIGNQQLLSYTKTGFLASSHIEVSDVMACYEWAARKPEPGCCVMSGFSSKMERDVLHFLLGPTRPSSGCLHAVPIRNCRKTCRRLWMRIGC